MTHIWGRKDNLWSVGSPAWKYWLRRTPKERHSLKEWKMMGMEEYNK